MGLYIKIDTDNVILGSQVPQEGYVWYEGEVPQYDAETQVLKWDENKIIVVDNKERITEKTKQKLAETDESIIRVIEDVIDVLIAKNIIDYQDLPEIVQEKQKERKLLREKLK